MAATFYQSSTWYICCVGWVLAYAFIVFETFANPRVIFHPWIVGFYFAWEVLHSTSKFCKSTFSVNALRYFSLAWATLDAVTVGKLLLFGYQCSTSITTDRLWFVFGFSVMAASLVIDGEPYRNAKYLSIPVTALCMGILCMDIHYQRVVYAQHALSLEEYSEAHTDIQQISFLYLPIAYFIALGNIMGALATWHKMPWGPWGKLSWILVSITSVVFILVVHLRLAEQHQQTGLAITSFLSLLEIPPITALLLICGSVLCSILGLKTYHGSHASIPTAGTNKAGVCIIPGIPSVDNNEWTTKGPFQFLVDNANAGDLYQFKKGDTMHLVVQNESMLKEIFRDVGKKLDRHPDLSKKELRGPRSLEFLSGEEHRDHKSAVLRAMSINIVKANIRQLYVLAMEYSSQLNGCNARECKRILREFALEGVSAIVFGELLPQDQLKEYSVLFRQHFDGFKTREKKVIEGSVYAKALSARDKLKQRLRDDVARCRAMAEGQADTHNLTEAQQNSVIYKLVSSTGKNLDNEDLVDHLLMLWAAGFEPVRITMAWMLAFMGTDDEVYRTAREEIDYVANKYGADAWGSDHEDINETITNMWNAVQNMKFMTAVFHEALRLRPPAPYVTFGINQDVPTFKVGNIDVPNDFRIMCGWTGILHNLDNYGIPERFDPRRFTGVTTMPYTFGGGNRVCPGRFFVKYEIMMFLFVLIRNFAPTIESTTETIVDQPNVSPKDLTLHLTSTPTHLLDGHTNE